RKRLCTSKISSIDEKTRCAARAELSRKVLLTLDGCLMRVRVERFLESRHVQADLLCVAFQILSRKGLLILEEKLVHPPKFGIPPLSKRMERGLGRWPRTLVKR